MATNKRTYYAVTSISVAECGTNTFTAVHGAQSLGINTTFNLEQVFELGQLALYSNLENIPDVEVSLEKVLDGYPLIYHLATTGAVSASLSGRQNRRATVGLSVYGDTQNSASGTPLSQATMSGMYVSNLSYTFPTQGNCTESVTLVGNNKVWNNSFTGPTFNNNDAPLFASGVQRRQDVMMGSGWTKLPSDIPGINATTNYNYLSGTDYLAHVQSIRTSVNLGREALYELGRRGPYHRYASFPTEVKTEIEVMALDNGDNVTALEDAYSNVSNQPIVIKTRDGGVWDLGTVNKLAAVTYGGANAGRGGGNATCTYSYSNFNDMSVTHPEDPSGL
mgnify:CR=1 FL=1